MEGQTRQAPAEGPRRRWTVKFTRAKPKEDGSTPPLDLAIPVFGSQNHVSIDCDFGFVRKWAAIDAAAYEGARLREGLLDKTNTASGVWADTAYRSAANEAFMEKHGFTSRVHPGVRPAATRNQMASVATEPRRKLIGKYLADEVSFVRYDPAFISDDIRAGTV